MAAFESTPLVIFGQVADHCPWKQDNIKGPLGVVEDRHIYDIRVDTPPEKRFPKIFEVRFMDIQTHVFVRLYDMISQSTPSASDL
ncbi:MAG TPA: hypothetical protein PK765_00940 [bacterium]|nr:hypothetical protein [bacterium]